MTQTTVILVLIGLAVVVLSILYWRRRMAMKDVKYWEIVIPPELVDILRTDERFHAIQKLSRIANSVRFTQVALTQHGLSDMPTAKRQRFSSFFYATAILFEGLRITETLGKDFSDLEEFKSGFGRIHADPKTRRLREGILDRARNQLVFHLDAEVPKASLATLNVDRWVVASGFGPQISESYFDLADVLLIHYLIDVPGSNEEFAPAWRVALIDVTALLLDFIESAEKLIPRVLKELGARIEFPTAPPDNRALDGGD